MYSIMLFIFYTFCYGQCTICDYVQSREKGSVTVTESPSLFFFLTIKGQGKVKEGQREI